MQSRQGGARRTSLGPGLARTDQSARRGRWLVGTATELLKEVEERVDVEMNKRRDWPNQPNSSASTCGGWPPISGGWAPVPLRFARSDVDRVPAHWRTVGARASALTGNPRLATNPANALLNYLYALLEAEASLAARIVGLDPGLGVLHADQLNRASLAADLMEPVRPLVDGFVLRLLEARGFALGQLLRDSAGRLSGHPAACARPRRDTAGLAASSRTSRRGRGAIARLR
jgi:hypothetical protein